MGNAEWRESREGGWIEEIRGRMQRERKRKRRKLRYRD